MENEKPGILSKTVKLAQIVSVVFAALALANEFLYFPIANAVGYNNYDLYLFFWFFSSGVRAAWSIATLAMGGLALLLLLILRLKQRSFENVNKKLTVAAVAAPLLVNILMRLFGGECF